MADKPLDAGAAIRDLRDADDLLEWLSRRWQAKRVPLLEPDRWVYTAQFEIELSHDSPKIPNLRDAIRLAMAKERE